VEFTKPIDVTQILAFLDAHAHPITTGSGRLSREPLGIDGSARISRSTKILRPATVTQKPLPGSYAQATVQLSLTDMPGWRNSPLSAIQGRPESAPYLT
jgi:hypothetical protein